MTITRSTTHPRVTPPAADLVTAATTEPSPRTGAVIAGLGYVAIFFLAVFANFFVRARLLDADDAAATFRNLQDSELLVRAALVAFLVVFVIDVVVAWALHVLFRPTGAARSLLSAWFRIVHTVFLGVAAIFLFLVLALIGDAEHLGAFTPDQLDSQVMLAMGAFNYTWLIGLAAFGVHLVLMGTIILRSGLGPRLLGLVLVVAGAAYVVDTAAYALLADYSDYENLLLAVVAIPSVIGELFLTIWLLTRAGRTSPLIA